jgi:hypothetical protein
MQNLRKVDIFPKFDSRFEKEARERTLLGGVLSLGALTFVVLLLIAETRYFFAVETRHDMDVDATPLDPVIVLGGGGPKRVNADKDKRELPLTFNITFVETPCDFISVDFVDAFGTYLEGVNEQTVKRPVNRQSGTMGEPVAHLEHKAARRVASGGAAASDIDAAVDVAKAQAQAQQQEGGDVACGSCYGAAPPGECCNSCQDVRNAYSRRGWSLSLNDVSIVQCAAERLAAALRLKNHEGCNVVGRLNLARVQGNLHFIPGRAFSHMGQHIFDLGSDYLDSLNLTHQIHEFRFGDAFPGKPADPLEGEEGVTPALSEAELPRSSGPAGEQQPPEPTARHMRELQGELKKNQKKQSSRDANAASSGDEAKRMPFGGGRFQYFLKVVPTRYETLSGEVKVTNQYAATEHYSSQTQSPKATGGMITPNQIPGIFFQFDLSPIVARIREVRPYRSFGHFILQLCAVAGGVFTVAGLVDSFVYHGAEQVRRKIQLGKMS